VLAVDIASELHPSKWREEGEKVIQAIQTVKSEKLIGNS
jgi:hypothetical protein